jgi:hypothetical protein
MLLEVVEIVAVLESFESDESPELDEFEDMGTPLEKVIVTSLSEKDWPGSPFVYPMTFVGPALSIEGTCSL